MTPDERLLAPTLASSLTLGPPWRCDNLRVSAARDDGNGPFITLELVAPGRNGHLEQWCTLDSGTRENCTARVSMRAAVSGGAGVNIYFHFHPTDDADHQVVQLAHPGDDAWHDVTRTIPMPERRVYRVRVLVVVRVGSGAVHLREVSLRQTRSPDRSLEATLDREQISEAYYNAVLAMVKNHPSAGDEAFRDKLTRYLLGSNRKGIANVAAFEELIAPRGKRLDGCRFLDLGSGSGGALVGALKAGAASVEGWEINVEKRALSEVNVSTCGVDSARVVVYDRSMESPPEIGVPFDIVFCEEVLEHVKDLDAAISTLAQCIGVDGIGYVTMPNGFAFKSVLADPHLSLFGIALLDRFEAQPLATALKNHTHYSAMMGAYHRHDEYVARFAKAGLSLTSVEDLSPSPKLLRQLAEELGRIEARRNSLGRDWGDQVEEPTLALLENRLDHYLAEAHQRLTAATENGATIREQENFVRDFGNGHFAYMVEHLPKSR